MSSARPSPWEHLVLTRRSACFPEWAALPPCFQTLTFVGFRILSFSPQRFYFRERVCACVAGGRRGRGRERPADAAVSLEEPDLQLSPAPREAVTGASITGRTPSRQSHPGAPAFLSLEGRSESGTQPVFICSGCVRSHYRLSGRSAYCLPVAVGQGSQCGVAGSPARVSRATVRLWAWAVALSLLGQALPLSPRMGLLTW